MALPFATIYILMCALIFDCCRNHLLLNNIGPQCTERIAAQIQPTNGSPFSLCLAECILRTGGVLTTKDMVIEKSKKNIEQVFNNATEFIPLMQNALEKCYEIVKNKMDAPIEISLPEDMCDPLTAITSQCTLIDNFINCPTAQWENSTQCNETRDYFVTCREELFQF